MAPASKTAEPPSLPAPTAAQDGAATVKSASPPATPSTSASTGPRATKATPPAAKAPTPVPTPQAKMEGTPSESSEAFCLGLIEAETPPGSSWREWRLPRHSASAAADTEDITWSDAMFSVVPGLRLIPASAAFVAHRPLYAARRTAQAWMCRTPISRPRSMLALASLFAPANEYAIATTVTAPIRRVFASLACGTAGQGRPGDRGVPEVLRSAAEYSVPRTQYFVSSTFYSARGSAPGFACRAASVPAAVQRGSGR